MKILLYNSSYPFYRKTFSLLHTDRRRGSSRIWAPGSPTRERTHNLHGDPDGPKVLVFS